MGRVIYGSFRDDATSIICPLRPRRLVFHFRNFHGTLFFKGRLCRPEGRYFYLLIGIYGMVIRLTNDRRLNVRTSLIFTSVSRISLSPGTSKSTLQFILSNGRMMIHSGLVTRTYPFIHSRFFRYIITRLQWYNLGNIK